MALMMNDGAMKTFVNLPEEEKQAVLSKARCAKSRDDMVALVDGLAQNTAGM